MKNVVLPAWELIFQKFRLISWFFFCWRAFQKSQFYLHGSSFFENLLEISVTFFQRPKPYKNCVFAFIFFSSSTKEREGKTVWKLETVEPVNTLTDNISKTKIKQQNATSHRADENIVKPARQQT